MSRFASIFQMLLRAASRMRRGKAPFTNRELVAGFSQVERARFPELNRFPDPPAAEAAWQQAADEIKGLWITFGLVVAAMLTLWSMFRSAILGWVSHQIVPGRFSVLCLNVLIGGFIGVIGIKLTTRLCHRSVRRSLRRQLNALQEPTCLACGYDLTGNESGRCPECGFSTSRG